MRFVNGASEICDEADRLFDGMIHGLLIEEADCRDVTRSVSFEVALLQFRPNGAVLFQPRARDQRERRPA